MRHFLIALTLLFSACAEPSPATLDAMPAPTDSPLWATDATFGTDGDDWDGDANRVEPSAGRRAEGFEPGPLGAEYLNWVLGVHGDHIDYIEGVIGGGAARTYTLQPIEGYADSGTFGPSASGNGGVVVSGGGGVWLIPLSVIPDGSTIVRIRVYVAGIDSSASFALRENVQGGYSTIHSESWVSGSTIDSNTGGAMTPYVIDRASGPSSSQVNAPGLAITLGSAADEITLIQIDTTVPALPEP